MTPSGVSRRTAVPQLVELSLPSEPHAPHIVGFPAHQPLRRGDGVDSCSDHGEPSGSSAPGTCMSHELSDKSQENGIDDVTTLTTDQVSDAVHVITSQGEMTLAPVGNATGLLARGEQPLGGELTRAAIEHRDADIQRRKKDVKLALREMAQQSQAERDGLREQIRNMQAQRKAPAGDCRGTRALAAAKRSALEENRLQSAEFLQQARIQQESERQAQHQLVRNRAKAAKEASEQSRGEQRALTASKLASARALRQYSRALQSEIKESQTHELQLLQARSANNKAERAHRAAEKVRRSRIDARSGALERRAARAQHRRDKEEERLLEVASLQARKQAAQLERSRRDAEVAEQHAARIAAIRRHRQNAGAEIEARERARLDVARSRRDQQREMAETAARVLREELSGKHEVLREQIKIEREQLQKLAQHNQVALAAEHVVRKQIRKPKSIDVVPQPTSLSTTVGNEGMTALRTSPGPWNVTSQRSDSTDILFISHPQIPCEDSEAGALPKVATASDACSSIVVMPPPVKKSVKPVERILSKIAKDISSEGISPLAKTEEHNIIAERPRFLQARNISKPVRKARNPNVLVLNGRVTPRHDIAADVVRRDTSIAVAANLACAESGVEWEARPLVGTKGPGWKSPRQPKSARAPSNYEVTTHPQSVSVASNLCRANPQAVRMVKLSTLRSSKGLELLPWEQPTYSADMESGATMLETARVQHIQNSEQVAAAGAVPLQVHTPSDLPDSAPLVEDSIVCNDGSNECEHVQKSDQVGPQLLSTLLQPPEICSATDTPRRLRPSPPLFKLRQSGRARPWIPGGAASRNQPCGRDTGSAAHSKSQQNLALAAVPVGRRVLATN